MGCYNGSSNKLVVKHAWYHPGIHRDGIIELGAG